MDTIIVLTAWLVVVYGKYVNDTLRDPLIFWKIFPKVTTLSTVRIIYSRAI